MTDINTQAFNPNKLIAARLGRGWTASFLATKIGVNRATVSRWESGKQNPRLGQIRKISKLLGVSKEDLTQAGVTA